MTAETYTDWQWEQKGCGCPIHRYHVAHLCACGVLVSHSQGDCDAHRSHEMIDFASKEYKHGESARETFERLTAEGLLDVFASSFQPVYAHFAEAE